ncbi:MAG: hypothetical protein ABI699_12980 [Caldimonas sp.]
MNPQSFAAHACRAAFTTLFVALLCAFAQAALAEPAGARPPAPTFVEASRLFRGGRHAAAYGRFVQLANEGDREAARIVLVMHKHGSVLFGSQWDASTEELVQWSLLAQRADRADIEARLRFGLPPSPGGVGGVADLGEAAVLAPESFRQARPKKR